MRKAYVKPMVEIETYELSASIAGSVGSIRAWETTILQAARYSQTKHTHTHTHTNKYTSGIFICAGC